MVNGKSLTELHLGILGGGQLGKMLCLAASNWNLNTTVLDPSKECPAVTTCSKFIRGNFREYDDVIKLQGNVDLATIEIEHVNIDGLRYLEEKGVEVRPTPNIIETIKDKGMQKTFYKDNNIPTSEFIICNSKDEVLNKINEGRIKPPFVQKLCREGYDGRGVLVVDTEDRLAELLDDECVVEDLVDIKKELSVIVAQNKLGEVKCFRPVEMVFNYDANLVDYLISPANISVELSREAEELAVSVVRAFGLYGLLSVEMFLTSENSILINEVAPRPHNSGHHTIESCITSQYEQHLRSLFDLPLGNTDIKAPSVMLNILGSQGYEGSAIYDGLNDCLKVEGASIHIYGKKKTRPFRKMGHVTILDDSIKNALDKANFIKQNLKVIA